jgi:hypothetical protein
MDPTVTVTAPAAAAVTAAVSTPGRPTIEELLPSLKTGDIVLFSGSFLFSALIRKVRRAPRDVTHLRTVIF